jgi:hypothetical protein
MGTLKEFGSPGPAIQDSQERIESSRLQSRSPLRSAMESHKLFLKIAGCDCTCEWWGNVGIRKDTRPPPNRRPFPPLSHGINKLTPISCPYGSLLIRRVERAMGIEPTRGALPSP